jgi:UPF0042 nucleotide-binding protein
VVRERVHPDDIGEHKLSVLIQSFGFKHGIPLDSDYVFDLRCLPNPHWDAKLRPYSGLDQPVAEFLAEREEVNEMYQDISRFLTNWMPRLAASNRSYVTISLGCTGGRHRSVYLADKLGTKLKDQLGDAVKIRHRDL